jgi:hypothetical protein
MPRLAQASWGHRPDAEERGAVQIDPGNHFGREPPRPPHLDLVPRRVEEVSHLLEPRHPPRLELTPDDPDPGVGAGGAHGDVVPLCVGGRVVGETSRIFRVACLTN